MAANLVGTTGLAFGCTDETYGYFESLTETDTSKKREVSDSDGDIKGAAWYGHHTLVDGEYVYLSDTSSPYSQVGTGTTVTVQTVEKNSGVIYIDECSNVFKGGNDPDYKRIRFRGVYYPSLGA